jgi:hypothetical protein
MALQTISQTSWQKCRLSCCSIFMNESLDELKRRLRTKYMGKAGIHGLGIDRSKDALRIYHEPSSDPEQERMLKEIEKEARPYKVIRIKEEPPKIT